MRKILYLLAATLLFATCKKKEPLTLHIEGVTLDDNAIAFAEVAGVQLKLEDKVLEGGVYNNNFQEVTTIQSDEFGKFKFDFDKRSTVEYRLTATKENFYDYVTILNPELIKPGLTYDKNVLLKPKAKLATVINNVNPETESDNITFRLLNAHFECACCTNETRILTGMAVSDSTTCNIWGNSWVKYLYTVNRVGVSPVTTIDSLFCHSFETSRIEIDY